MSTYSIFLEIRVPGHEKSSGKICKSLREVIQVVQKVAEKYGVERPAGAAIKRELAASGEYLFAAEGKFDVYTWNSVGVDLKKEMEARVERMRNLCLNKQPINEDDFSPAISR